MSVPPDGDSQSVGEPRGTPQPETGAITDADVHAFLIGDIRGWTSFTQEHGDEVAARLAARFAEVAREVVEDHRGRVVDLRGDEVMAVFGSPRSAIRAAVALQQRFVEESTADPSLPLTVGIGLDAGEAVAVEGGYRGGALNVAGRLQARAKAGEILASREIVHLARRIDGILSSEHAALQLKGLDQPVHVIAIRSEHQDAAEAMAPFVRMAVPAPSPRKRWKVVAALAAFALLVALVAVPLARNAESTSEIAPNSIGILDPTSGEVISTLELDARPGSIAASGQDVWVTNPDAGTVTRIDPGERDVRDPIQVGEDPSEIAVGGDVVWVVESGGPSVSRISDSTNFVEGEPIEVGNGPADIAVSKQGVWVTNRFDGSVSRIDANSGEVVNEIPVGLDPRGIAVGFGSVWVALAGSNAVVRIDPVTDTVSAPISVGNAPQSLAVGSDSVWVANTLDNTVSRLSPDTNAVSDVVPVGGGPSGIAVVGGGVWTANEADGTLSRIEPGTNPGETVARAITVESVPTGLAEVNGELWVSVRGTATSHRGGTLKLVGEIPVDSLDPSFAYDSISWRVSHLLGDGLLTFETVGGSSASLVPDLALSIPIPTDGGHTYTFQLRPGIRYSNGEIVVPSDFRYGIERVFLLRSTARFLFQGLDGADACAEEPRTCDLREGIEADDATGTITFHLVEPDPEFPNKLTTPLAYPVPPSVPDRHLRNEGVPGTGPYTLEAPMTGEGLTLVRNPHFQVWSPAAQPDGFPDRIEWTFGMSTQAQVETVAAGNADLSFDAGRSDQLDDLFVRFAAQLYSSPNPQTLFIVLDTETPPFDDPDVRRAMNLLIDRDRIVRIFGGEKAMRPTCQQIPPNFPGYQPYCPYTENPGPRGEGVWGAPGLSIEKARVIVRRSGTAGMRIAFTYVPKFWPQSAGLGRYLIRLLGAVGYDVRVQPLPQGVLYDPGHEFQMAQVAWSSDYPAASTFINEWFTCDASLTPLSGFCDPEIDEMIEDATRVQVEDPPAAGMLWAKIDRAIVDQAPYVWLMNPNTVEFVAERVDNYQFSTQWGVLLSQLWVQ